MALPGLVGGIVGFLAALGAFVLRILSFIVVVFSWIGIVFSSLPFLIIALAVTAVMIPWVNYHDRIIEEAEFGMRTKVYPVWRDTVRDFINLLRRVYNPLVCWWNAFNWWFFGLFREAIFPTTLDCNPTDMLVNLGEFLFAVTEDFIADYVANGNFLTEKVDFTNICNTWIAFFSSWIDLYSCTCMDLGDVLKSIPILPPPIPIPILWITVFFSEQWTDLQTWCFISNLVDASSALLSEFLLLALNILQVIANPPGPVPFPLPDFRRFFNSLCDSASCLVRSYENAIQRFWDMYVPFDFVFAEYLCVLDSLACIIFKLADNLLRILINIVKVVIYPADPFWETVIKPDFTEWVNLIAAPTQFADIPVPSAPNPTVFTIRNYFLDTTIESLPNGNPNPVFGKRRFSECVCIFITRTICDPSNMDTACFSEGAQELLSGLDFCCLPQAALRLIVNLLAGFFEFTLYLARGSDIFFLFVDENPWTTLLKNDLVVIVDCVLQIFTLIPEVGTCLKDLIVGIAKYLLCLIDFLWRVIVGLATLPYFLIRLPSVPNFVSRTSEALDFFIQINEDLIAPVPNSVRNCLCLLLNKGFPIPPIPCPSCQVGGFIEPPEAKKRRMFDPVTGETYSPWQMATNTMGWGPSKITSRVTPLIRYTNHTFDPLKMAKLVWVNSKDLNNQHTLVLPDLSTVDRFVDIKKREILERWQHKRTCTARREEDRTLRITEPHKWNYNKRNGRYNFDDCGKANMTWMEQPYSEERKKHDVDQRLTIAPTQPPLASCVDPIPPCFDLCCIFRSLLDWGVHNLNFQARFINGFAQYEASRWSHLGVVNDFPYFTGEFCDVGVDCFESDVVTFIINTFAPFKCACEFINLVIPVLPGNPREDLCCYIQRQAELIACIFQVIINSINALALGAGESPPYSYFINNMFFEDVSALFDITLELLECVCVLVRGIFPLQFIPGYTEAVDFDICCLPQALWTTLIEIIRLLLQSIIALATISVTPESFCFFRLDTTAGCPGTLDEIGFVKQLDVILDSYFPVRDSACQMTCGKDQGQGGWIPCACQVLNTLLPARDNPAMPVSCDPENPNCPTVDFCCPLVKAGIAANDLGKFLSRFLAALWQSWVPGYPEFWTNYMFCDETGSASCTVAVGPPACGCGTFTCGKLRPFIMAIVDPVEGLIARCLCEFFSLLDILLSDFFALLGGTWGNCWCSSTQGILPSASNIVQSVLFVATDLIRKFPLLCYWKPCNPDPPANCVFDSVEESWIFSFLGPVADSLCIAVGNLMCFVNSVFLLPSQCLVQGQEFLGGAVRWIFEAIFRIISFIEGFIRQFTDEPVTCVGGDCGTGPGEAFGVQPNPLGSILTALLSFPIDLLIGDSDVACSTICPCIEHGDSPSNCIDDADVLNDRCVCWDFSPNYPGGGLDCLDAGTPQDITMCLQQERLWVHETVGCPMDPMTMLPQTECCRLSIPAPEGIPQVIDICQSPTGPKGMEGSCVVRTACRPDTLPSCATHPDTNPFLAAPYQGSLDGIVVALLRYMQCVLGDVGAIFKPLIILFSILWQILGGVMRFISALLIFILSLFDFSGGCDCHNYVDPMQNGTVKHIQRGLLCYPCPDVNSACSDIANACGVHCPVFTGSAQNCIAALNSGDPTADYNTCIGGGFGAEQACTMPGQIDLCIDPGCQVGGDGRWPACGCNGCTFPDNPLPLCSFLLAIGRFFDVIGAFIAIFTQPIMIPDSRNLGENPSPGVSTPYMREGRMEFRKRVSTMMSNRNKGFANSGNIFEAAMAALYDYDTSDCYDDPVTCACRNFHMPEHCTYDSKRGVIHTRDTPMTTTELTTYVSDMFTDTSVCDHAISRCGGMDWSSVPEVEKDEWVGCVDKRVQSERLHDVAPVVPKNFMYTSRSPYVTLQNIMSNLRQDIYHEHETYTRRHQERAANFEQHWPRFDERLAKRRKFARNLLETKKNIKRTSPIFEAMVKADQVWFKFQTGYYNYLLERASNSVRGGNWNFPSTKTALTDMAYSLKDLGHVTYNQPYKKLVSETVHATKEIGRLASEVWERGILNTFNDKRKERQDRYWRLYGKAKAEKKALLLKAWHNSPLYTWWFKLPTEKQGLFGPLVEHIGRTIEYQREHWRSENFSFWNADLKMAGIKEAFIKRWTPKWTPEKLANWDKPKRLALRLYDIVYPNTLSEETRKRFIFNCNCLIGDRAAAVTVNAIDYCLNGFMPNVDFTKRSEKFNRLGTYLNNTSPYRKGGYFSHENKWRLEMTEPKDKDAWIRPRVKIPEREPKQYIDRRVYRRNAMAVGPSGFNLIDQFVCWLEDIFNNPMLSQDLEQFFDDLREWFLNPSMDVNDYPDVGFVYWAT